MSQDGIINAYISSVTFDNSTISDLVLNRNSIEIVASTLELTDMNVKNISNPGNYEFIVTSLGSTLNIRNVHYSFSDSIFFNLVSSEMETTNLTFLNINRAEHLFKIYDSNSVVMDDIKAINVSTDNLGLFSISNTNDILIRNSDFHNITQLVFDIKQSESINISNCVFTNMSQGAKITNSNLVDMKNVSFANGGASDIQQGGAISIRNSVVAISNSSLINNTAQNGAAISLV